MILKKIKIYPWISNIPILIIFLLIISFYAKNIPVSDGIRYWDTSSKFISFFSNVNLVDTYLFKDGPFYPFVLSILRFFGFPLIACIYFNAFFIYLSSIYFFKSLNFFLNKKYSLIFCYLLFFIDPFLFYWSTKLYTEPLSIFLVCLFIFSLVSYFNNKKSNKYLYITSITFGLLSLTRVIFAYVSISLFLIFLFKFFITSDKINAKKFLKISSFSILFIIPYLLFTFSITGKKFFLSSTGGSLIYWTSSPYKTDLGEWHVFNMDDLKDHLAYRYNYVTGVDSTLQKTVNDKIIEKIKNDHKNLINSLVGYNQIERDSILKNKAYANIKENPISFLKNWVLNAGRLLIGYPHALYFKPPYSPLLSLLNILKSSLVLFIFLGSLLFLLFKNKDDKILKYFMIIAIIYLGGQSLLAVQSQRFLLPIYPFLFYIISMTYKKIISNYSLVNKQYEI